ncbi:MAG TPA: ribonuclease D [Tepidisphaeraceae bacterium]|nr:ribonuclease D [Tepidisphaeraceae bacterium]
MPPGPGELITTNTALAHFIEHLRQQRCFAYDSEFIGELSYYPRLCLIQAATTQRIGLIDPLAGIDLSGFWQLLSDPSIQKIVHAGEQDIEPVHRLSGSPAANIFDTQVAAGFVGMAYPVGLSKLLHELLKVRIGKGLTFTHWDQRPLTPLQLKYAADDVRYLPAVAAVLTSKLEELGHAEWAHQECASLCDPRRYEFDPQSSFLRIRGAGSLTPQHLAVLRELTIWRDAAARAHDLPPRAFLKDEILLDLARSPVKSVEKLDRVKGLPRPIELAHGAAIVEATLRGLALPPAQRPTLRSIEPTPSERFAADSLFAAASALCAGQSIDPALVTSRQEVAELHRALTQGIQSPDLNLLKGWRAAACGNRLLELVRGGAKLELSWRDGRLHAS